MFFMATVFTESPSPFPVLSMPKVCFKVLVAMTVKMNVF
jgi:hypothetical protein